MIYHENLACSSRSAIEWTPCRRSGARLLVGDGFDFAIDDCALPEPDRGNYGQCDHLDEREDGGAASKWWFAHTQSLAARRIAAYEVPASLG